MLSLLTALKALFTNGLLMPSLPVVPFVFEEKRKIGQAKNLIKITGLI